MVGWWFVPMSFLAVVARILGQPTDPKTEGFISIDCGFDESSSYDDQTTGLTYVSDNGFIDSGVNYNIDVATPNLVTQLNTLRSFPIGARNCYSFTTIELGTKLLIRASFLYGNYDDQNNTDLSFDLWLGTKFWTTITLREATEADGLPARETDEADRPQPKEADGPQPLNFVSPVIVDFSASFYAEVITVVTTKYLWVCLVNTRQGNPFISALELRPLDSNLYLAADESQPLILSTRWDYGSSAYLTRYPDDQYDRFWLRPTSTNCLTTISTNKTIGKLADDVFQVPPSVMQTGVTPCIDTDNLTISWDAATYGANNIYCKYYFFMHFADFQKESTRTFQAYINQDWTSHEFTPEYLQDDHIYPPRPYQEVEYEITLQKTSDSRLPPLINAMEVYRVTATSVVATNPSDVDALMSVKKQYQVKKIWMGDPCAPQENTWDGVNCHYHSKSGTPRVISLNMSSSRLTGGIPSSLAKLDAITSLDLSNNSLEGEIPDFLAALPSLQLLNLTGNNLRGSIPLDLSLKSQNGSFTLSVEDNPNLCTNASSCGQNHCPKWGSCGRKRTIILSLSVVAVVLVVGLMLCVWRLGSRKSTSSIVIDCQKYTYAELGTITENFRQVLGGGGFGTVYHGTLKNGTEVAVKKLSEKSEHATRGFLAEVQILTRTHHTSLVHLVGYWSDGGSLALVYEYMAEGSLQDHLPGKGAKANARSLNWIERLKIALGAAQGLEYLHVNCTPPVVHRDVKTSNILLNEKLEAKVADFGLSKAFRSGTQTHLSMETIGGTPGYVDPEYNTTGLLSHKSDVYSFGVVLFELITGLPALQENAEVEHIVPWVDLKLESGGIAEIVDSSLQEYCIKSMLKVAELARKCTENTRNKRPSMSEVVADLKESLKLAARESFEVECSEAPLFTAE